jgi:hypothetical protein
MLQNTDQNKCILVAQELDDTEIVVRLTTVESKYFPLQTVQTGTEAHSGEWC